MLHTLLLLLLTNFTVALCSTALLKGHAFLEVPTPFPEGLPTPFPEGLPTPFPEVSPQSTHLINISFYSPFSYGLLFAAFDSYGEVFRIILRNNTLLLIRGDITQQIPHCCTPLHWNTFSITLQSDLVNVSTPHSSSTAQIGGNVRHIFIGGVQSGGGIGPYHQYSGLLRVTLDRVDILRNATSLNTRNIRVLGQDEGGRLWEDEDEMSYLREDPLQTVTLNSSLTTFPVAATNFLNFSLEFEFRSPENTLQLLTYSYKNHEVSLRRDYKQLVLTLNLHGEEEELTVELSSLSEWVHVRVRVADTQTSLSATDHHMEVKSRNPIISRKLEKRPLQFGGGAAPGFRGCVRGLRVDGREKGLYELALPSAGTLVGCWYPTPSCEQIQCQYSCSQTWQSTQCVNGAELPGTAEFAGFGILQMEVPHLISSNETSLDLELKFLSHSSKDDVIMNLQHSQNDMNSLLTLQMLEGFVMLSLDTTDVMLYTVSQLNDGNLHSVRVSITETEISFQVDNQLERQTHSVDVTIFKQPTSIMIGGSSLKINNYGFTGCLSDIMINGADLLSKSTYDQHNIFIKDVILGQCSLVLAPTPFPPVTPLSVSRDSDVTSTTQPGSPKSGISRQDVTTITAGIFYRVGTSISDSGRRSNVHERRDEHLMIGLMLGFVTLLAAFLFLAYFLWQRRQMHRAELARIRKASADEPCLDEEFLNKTYNPKKQDKYTLFTPHALDAIAEESESIDRSSITSSLLSRHNSERDVIASSLL